MKKSRRLMAAILTAVFIGMATVPAAAAPTLYYSTTQQLKTYQKYNNWLISKGYEPYNLVPAPASQPKPVPSPTPAPASTPAPQPSTTGTDALLTAPITAQEKQMVNLVNQERTSLGLKALTVDSRLLKVARMKSMDMINNNYFGHQSPVYGSPYDLMKFQGITYKTAAENIAGNSSVTAAHTSLMNSSGHRANILNANFTQIGIGIIKGGPYGLMISQEFIG
ncbi:CAP domain-containing protein [Sporomusa aerivorans]|uniref:CAP domain-containing protein n=1 Tax=Sporomusa aerivorans TaxID=204936 RepID=UPI00352B1C1C